MIRPPHHAVLGLDEAARAEAIRDAYPAVGVQRATGPHLTSVYIGNGNATAVA